MLVSYLPRHGVSCTSTVPRPIAETSDKGSPEFFTLKGSDGIVPVTTEIPATSIQSLQN